MAVKLIEKRIHENYGGMSISPFVPFSKSDWYGYQGAEKIITEDEPLIFHGDDIEIVISGNGNDGGCVIEVYLYADIAEAVYTNFDHPMSLSDALKLGETISKLDGSGIDKIGDYLKNKTNLVDAMA